LQNVALPASSRTARAVAEVLNKGAVVFLYSGCGRCVAISRCAINHVKACLSLVQPQLDVGTAAPWEILRPPLNIENAVRRSATYRGEYAKSTVNQIQVVPVREDRVVMGGPRQALVGEGRVGGHELRIAVGGQVNRGIHLIVQRVREGKRDRCDRIIPVVTDVHRARHDTATYLIDSVLTYASW